MPDPTQIVVNEAESRLELNVGDHTAFVAYERLGDSLVLLHTEVPRELRGGGIGSELARGTLDYARERGLEVVPVCPFIASYIRRHPEYLDLVSEANRRRLDRPEG